MDPIDSSITHNPSFFLAQSEPAQVARVTKVLLQAIAQDWGLNASEQARLLGLASSESFSEDYLDGSKVIPEALLIRVSHLWNIHRAITTLVPAISHGTWIRNCSTALAGCSPLEIMLRDGEVGIEAIDQYLGAQMQ